MTHNKKTLRTFLIVWFGQLISMFGTGMTRFALIIWAYQETESATTLALMGFFSFSSIVLFSSVAGIWIDRLDRKKVLILSDLGAGLVTVGYLGLISADALQLWHLYLGQFIVGGLDAFQSPAYITTTTILLPKKHYTRANGLRSLSMQLSEVLAPAIGAVLLVSIGLEGVMLIDVVTFLFAVGSIIIINIPKIDESDDDADTDQNGTSYWQKLTFGYRYIYQRKGLMGLLIIFININFLSALTYFGVMPALILAKTNSDEIALATVQSALGIGGIIGAVLMSTWGGPKKRIHSILAGSAIAFVLVDGIFAVSSDLTFWVIGAIIGNSLVPFISGGHTSIWQDLVPINVQGRVFVVQNALRVSTMPLGYLFGGILADYVFEPAMMPNGALADTFGWLVGTGTGAGMALMFAVTCLLGLTNGLSGYFFPRVRDVESSESSQPSPKTDSYVAQEAELSA